MGKLVHMGEFVVVASVDVLGFPALEAALASSSCFFFLFSISSFVGLLEATGVGIITHQTHFQVVTFQRPVY
jgi:hypothetical protein